MKILVVVLALTALAGCAIVPLAYYDPYPSPSYRPSTNDYYSSGYPAPQYSYGYTYPYGYGYGYSRPAYPPGYYGRGYQRPSYPGYYGYGR
jgi:hypothetical protein